MADLMWLIVVVGGPLLLGGVIAFAILRQRKLSGKEQQEQTHEVEKLYDGK